MVDLAREFSARGLTIDLVVGRAEGPYLAQVSSRVRLVDLRARRVLASLPGLVRYLRQNRPDALLSAMDHANLVALGASTLARVPTRVIVSVRCSMSEATRYAATNRERWIPYFVRRLYPRADAIVAVGQGVADDLARTTGIAREAIEVIYNPVVSAQILDQASAALEHPWVRPGALPVILGVGRLARQKDFPTLIKAFARLRQETPARLLILGEGEERDRLEALVRRLGLDEQVALPGFVENPFAYMARARVFALSSKWEGLPGVLIQAMACGCTVVSTDCPSGPREILADGDVGALVPVGDVDALAAALGRAIREPGDADRLRARAAAFSVEASVARYLDLLYARERACWRPVEGQHPRQERRLFASPLERSFPQVKISRLLL